MTHLSLPHPQPRPAASVVPGLAYGGFVVAMRARMVTGSALWRHEWIIVSRWGLRGEHLTVALTGVVAEDGEAPVGLMPRQTALAVADGEVVGASQVTFALAPSLPARITVAGEFLPAQGYVRLYGRRERPRIRTKARCLLPGTMPGWRMEAAREAWMGEFIEPAGKEIGWSE